LTAFKGFYHPHFVFNSIFTPLALLTLIMANIGTTITPWQIFFQRMCCNFVVEPKVG
jgi:Mn2+/Fe2+ NRAMP family transporter